MPNWLRPFAISRWEEPRNSDSVFSRSTRRDFEPRRVSSFYYPNTSNETGICEMKCVHSLEIIIMGVYYVRARARAYVRPRRVHAIIYRTIGDTPEYSASVKVVGSEGEEYNSAEKHLGTRRSVWRASRRCLARQFPKSVPITSEKTRDRS